jgi:hypothetical protein
MAIIDVPDNELIVIDSFDFDTPRQFNRSEWTKRGKTIDLGGGDSWSFTFHVEDVVTEIDERPWRVFLVNLGGPANKFRLQVACSQHDNDNPTVMSGATAGNTLSMQGLPISSTALRAGQFMTVPLPSGHERLLMLVQNLNTNASGQGTAVFKPSLDEIPTAGTVVETINPWSLVRLPEARNGWKVSDGVSEFQFAADEAL